LESIVKQLEAGELSLEEALAVYEKGVNLAAQCRKVLGQAEQKVAILSKIGTDQATLEPYEKEDQTDD
jgi:exodeoxyribonuclease VII small subunit